MQTWPVYCAVQIRLEPYSDVKFYATTVTLLGLYYELVIFLTPSLRNTNVNVIHAAN